MLVFLYSLRYHVNLNFLKTRKKLFMMQYFRLREFILLPAPFPPCPALFPLYYNSSRVL